MKKNSISWDKGVALSLLALVVAILTLVATFTVPELRLFFGLEKETVSPPTEATRPTVPPPEPENEKSSPESPIPSGPTRLTLRENQSEFIAKAQTSLSIVFHDVLGEEVASLTIAPDGKNASPHAVLDGYTQEFASSAGTFLVQIVHVDYEGRGIELQVTERP